MFTAWHWPHDSVFEASVPTRLHRHRHLIRYRIEATDANGSTVRVPYGDDTQSNFAYFCYDEIPAWTGANWPGKSSEVTFEKKVMNQLPAIHLLAKQSIVESSQYLYRFNEVFQPGTLVVGDRVFDHIRFRNRGETTTYMVGKNKWRFNFNRTHEFEPHVLDGRAEKRRWKRLNLNPGTVPYFPKFRGSAALNERLAFRIYQLAGIPAPDTAYVQLRVVDDASETGRDQYSGDLWGLYMAFESIDSFMLDNCKEPDGELHRIGQSGNSVEREPARPVPADQSFASFWDDIQQRQSETWWRKNVDLERYCSFHAVSIATARTDQKLFHNYVLYRHPERGWQPLPWDTDQCMRPVRYQPNSLRWHSFLKYCLQHQKTRTAYRNRARELLDLLFTKDQIGALVDEMVRDLGPHENGFAVIDQFLWNYNPQTQFSHRGSFFLNPIGLSRHRDGTQHETIKFEQAGFAGRVQYFKDFLATAAESANAKPKGKRHVGMGAGQLSADIHEPDIPVKPIIGRARETNDLRFRCSQFKDPQGNETFGGMQWRVGEVYNNTVSNYKQGDHYRYEVSTVWESPVLKRFTPSITIPSSHLQPGHSYRVRVRFMDTSNHWSHWSAPIAFVAARPDVSAYQGGLVISEIMYHPPRMPIGKLGPEFIELTNTGDKPLDLRPLRFNAGIEFRFADSEKTTLSPGERRIVTDDAAAFRKRHPDCTAEVDEWTAGKLSNSGETLALSYSEEIPLIKITYEDQAPWPSEADGSGRSLELVKASGSIDVSHPKSWKASDGIGGSPGK